jgi:hypothetical protein
MAAAAQVAGKSNPREKQMANMRDEIFVDFLIIKINSFGIM